MPKTIKIAISLPDDMLTDVEQERSENGESRDDNSIGIPANSLTIQQNKMLRPL